MSLKGGAAGVAMAAGAIVWRIARAVAILGPLLAACTAVAPPPSPPRPAATFTETGLASWYGPNHEGKVTASGDRFRMNDMTAAHRSLPMDTVVRVTNLDTGAVVKVRINDRGPFVKGRIIDLSIAAAHALSFKQDGVARVRIEVFAADQE
jgi:rare lipoprotein A